MSLSLEKAANSTLNTSLMRVHGFLCRRELHVADNGAELFVRLTSKCEPEVQECHDVVPFVGDLALIDPGHKFERSNGVFSRFPIEIR